MTVFRSAQLFVIWRRQGVSALAALLIAGRAVHSSAQAPTNSIDLEEFHPNIPLVFLESKEPIAGDQRVPCSFRMVYPKDVGAGVTNVLPGVVKYHGATSQAYAKKSFAVSLEAPVSLLGMRTNAHWILNASYIDRSLMRHKLGYDLFRSLSTTGDRRFAVASRFVEVRLNNRYHGIYLLMERVDRTLLELRPYNSNETSHACIYKAVDHAANFSRAGHAGYEQREPEPITGVWWQPLDRLNRFVVSASDADFFKAQTGIESRLDSSNAMDFLLLVLLTSNLDGITKNFILACDATAADATQPRFFFVPWDYDGTFGRNWDATRVEPNAWLSNHLFDRLLANPDWCARLAARWKHLREREFSLKTIQSMMESNSRALGDAVLRNESRWPVKNGPYPDALTFSEDITEMKTWVEARLKWLDEEIQRRAIAPPK